MVEYSLKVLRLILFELPAGYLQINSKLFVADTFADLANDSAKSANDCNSAKNVNAAATDE